MISNQSCIQPHFCGSCSCASSLRCCKVHTVQRNFFSFTSLNRDVKRLSSRSKTHVWSRYQLLVGSGPTSQTFQRGLPGWLPGALLLVHQQPPRGPGGGGEHGKTPLHVGRPGKLEALPVKAFRPPNDLLPELKTGAETPTLWWPQLWWAEGTMPGTALKLPPTWAGGAMPGTAAKLPPEATRPGTALKLPPVTALKLPPRCSPPAEALAGSGAVACGGGGGAAIGIGPDWPALLSTASPPFRGKGG